MGRRRAMQKPIASDSNRHAEAPRNQVGRVGVTAQDEELHRLDCHDDCRAKQQAVRRTDPYCSGWREMLWQYLPPARREKTSEIASYIACQVVAAWYENGTSRIFPARYLLTSSTGCSVRSSGRERKEQQADDVSEQHQSEAVLPRVVDVHFGECPIEGWTADPPGHDADRRTAGLLRRRQWSVLAVETSSAQVRSAR